jgi:chromosome segregation ATPase
LLVHSLSVGQDAEISRLEKAVRHHENTIAALRANIENLTNEKNRFSEDLKELRPEYEKLKGTA